MGTILQIAEKLNAVIVEELGKEKPSRSERVALSSKDNLCYFCKEPVLKGTDRCKNHQNLQVSKNI